MDSLVPSWPSHWPQMHEPKAARAVSDQQQHGADQWLVNTNKCVITWEHYALGDKPCISREAVRGYMYHLPSSRPDEYTTSAVPTGRILNTKWKNVTKDIIHFKPGNVWHFWSSCNTRIPSHRAWARTGIIQDVRCWGGDQWRAMFLPDRSRRLSALFHLPVFLVWISGHWGGSLPAAQHPFRDSLPPRTKWGSYLKPRTVYWATLHYYSFKREIGVKTSQSMLANHISWGSVTEIKNLLWLVLAGQGIN